MEPEGKTVVILLNNWFLMHCEIYNNKLFIKIVLLCYNIKTDNILIKDFYDFKIL